MSNNDQLKQALINAVEMTVRDHLRRAVEHHGVNGIKTLLVTREKQFIIRNMAEAVRDAMANVAADTAFAENEPSMFSATMDELYCTECGALNGQHKALCSKATTTGAA